MFKTHCTCSKDTLSQKCWLSPEPVASCYLFLAEGLRYCENYQSGYAETKREQMLLEKMVPTGCLMQGRHKPICEKKKCSVHRSTQTRCTCISHQLQTPSVAPESVYIAIVQGGYSFLQLPLRKNTKRPGLLRGARERTRNSRSSSSSWGSNSSWRKAQPGAGGVSNTDPGACQGSHVNPRGCAGSWPKAPRARTLHRGFQTFRTEAQDHSMRLTQWIPTNQQTIISEHLNYLIQITWLNIHYIPPPLME